MHASIASVFCIYKIVLGSINCSHQSDFPKSLLQKDPLAHTHPVPVSITQAGTSESDMAAARDCWQGRRDKHIHSPGQYSVTSSYAGKVQNSNRVV